jgi:ABC-type glycerol-3-phosphate transport system substrate-binding protein
VPLDKLFRKNALTKESFYSSLLDLGAIEGKQYLLPVSFNIPALIFASANSRLPSDPFTISLDEIRRLGAAFNRESRGIYARMGFSPSWDDEFLYIVAGLFQTNFREASPISWDPVALDRTFTFLADWIETVNTSIQAEDEFVFKYFFEPPTKLILSGRILFSYMDSAELFTLSEETAASLDFRWLENDNSIPLMENSVYLGIARHGRARRAAEAFVEWFFRAETQRFILERNRANRLNETTFGIANGFSAVRQVTGQIFPQFYPAILGHTPPADFFTPPAILPSNWLTVKERVILPWFHERIRAKSLVSIDPLDRRISEWYRINPVH